MREVLVVARCDRCKNKIENVSDEPLPKWLINGTTYRPELCGTCEGEVLAELDFLTPVTTRSHSKKPEKKRRTGGKFAKVESACPVKDCGKVFNTPAGLSQHMQQTVRHENRNGTHRRYLKETT